MLGCGRAVQELTLVKSEAHLHWPVPLRDSRDRFEGHSRIRLTEDFQRFGHEVDSGRR
jgi:hypothetical protein